MKIKFLFLFFSTPAFAMITTGGSQIPSSTTTASASGFNLLGMNFDSGAAGVSNAPISTYAIRTHAPVDLYFRATPMRLQTSDGDFTAYLQADNYDLTWQFYEIAGLDVGAGVKYFDMLYRETFGFAKTQTTKIIPLYVPVLYLGYKLELVWNFYFSVEARGFAYKNDQFSDANLELHWYYGFVDIGVGYRSLAAQRIDPDLNFNMRMQGPYALLAIVF